MLSSGHGSALNSTPVSTETRASFLLSSIVCVSIHARMFTVHIHACTQIFVNSPIRWNYCVHLSIFNAPESWVMPLADPSHASTSLFLSYAEKDASLQYVTLRLNISMTTHCWSINLWLVSASSSTSDVMLPSFLWPPLLGWALKWQPGCVSAKTLMRVIVYVTYYITTGNWCWMNVFNFMIGLMLFLILVQGMKVRKTGILCRIHKSFTFISFHALKFSLFPNLILIRINTIFIIIIIIFWHIMETI